MRMKIFVQWIDTIFRICEKENEKIIKIETDAKQHSCRSQNIMQEKILFSDQKEDADK